MKENIKYILIGVVALLILAATFFSAGTNFNGQQSSIFVSGEGFVDITPDEGTFTITLENEGFDAEVVENENSAKMNEIMGLLKNAGIEDDGIETLYYNFYPLQDWDRISQTYTDKGFQASHNIKISTKDIENVGDYLSIAIKAGVTRVGNIQFEVSKERQQEAKEELYATASLDAKRKADQIASNLGNKVIKAIKVTEQSYSPYYPRMAYAEMAMDSTDGAMGAPIVVGDQSLTVQLQVEFLIR